MTKHERKVAKVTRKRNRWVRTEANLAAQIEEYTRIRENGRFEVPRWLVDSHARAAGKVAALTAELEQLAQETLVNRLEGLIDGH